MNKALILTALLGVAALAGVLYTTKNMSTSNLRVGGLKYETEFKEFTGKYQKQYGHDEGFYRYQFFAANMEIIKQHNALYEAGESTYFLAANPLADMNVAEYKSKLLGFKAVEKTVLDTEELTTTVSSIDWVAKGAVNAVKNQGQCGSCWAFSATCALEGLNFITNGKLQSFSEQSVMDCSTSYGNNGCNGGLMDYAFQYTEKAGIPTESSYPYKAADGSCKSFTSAFKNSGYKDVTRNSDSAMVAAITKGPVSVAIEADTSAFQLYSGGIFNNSACGTTLDHGVVAVGFGSGYFKIRNSWGASWGESGYIRLARTGNDAGMCGVQSSASYPTA